MGMNGVQQGCPIVLARGRIGIGTAGDQTSDGCDVTLPRGVGQGSELRVGTDAASNEHDGQQGQSHLGLHYQVLYEAKYRPTQSLMSSNFPSSARFCSHLLASLLGTRCTRMSSPSTPPPFPCCRSPLAR